MFVVLVVAMVVGILAIEIIEFREKLEEFRAASRKEAYLNHQKTS